MPTHMEVKVLPYTPEQMFDLVADINKYPQFLPWCVAARIKERQVEHVLADMMVGYKMIREKFTSKVILRRPEEIEVFYLDGPLQHLHNTWMFSATPEGHCKIDFCVEFEFSSPFLQKLANVFFNEAVKRMVSSFEARAEALYGTPSETGNPLGNMSQHPAH